MKLINHQAKSISPLVQLITVDVALANKRARTDIERQKIPGRHTKVWSFQRERADW